MRRSLRYQKVIQYFLQGLLILGPVSITIYFIYEIFDKIDMNKADIQTVRRQHRQTERSVIK